MSALPFHILGHAERVAEIVDEKEDRTLSLLNPQHPGFPAIHIGMPTVMVDAFTQSEGVDPRSSRLAPGK